jgi:type I restriction enzyme S subunit
VTRGDEWSEVGTGDLIALGALLIGDGYRAKNSEFVPGGGLPFVRVGDVHSTVQTDGIDELPFDNRARYEPKVSQVDDCLITMKGTVGRVARVAAGTRPFVYSPQIAFWRVLDRATLDPRFLSYWLRSPEFLRQSAQVKGATDMADYINLRDQRRMRITLPPVRTQVRIGAVLAAFDELIEINERRSELLENLARSLYREWFVRMRAPAVESEPGEVPDGWQCTDLGSIARWYSGGTPSTKDDAFWDGGIPWITSGSLRSVLLSDSDRTLTSAGIASGSRMVERDAVLFVVRGMSLVREVRAGIAERALAFGQDCKALVAVDGVEPLFLAFTVLDRQTTMHGMVELAGHGTGKLSTDRIKALPVALPPLAVQQQFVNSVTPIRAGMAAAMEAAHSLAHTRDLLLPRLVTGRLDIAEVDLSGLVESGHAG